MRELQEKLSDCENTLIDYDPVETRVRILRCIET